MVNSCEKDADKYKSAYNKNLSVTIFLHNGWGYVNSVGSNLGDLREILDKLPNKGYGVCLDHCHAFMAEYDLRTSDAPVRFIDKFDRIVVLILLNLFI